MSATGSRVRAPFQRIVFIQQCVAVKIPLQSGRTASHLVKYKAMKLETPFSAHTPMMQRRKAREFIGFSDA